jgi:hypothetical protein
MALSYSIGGRIFHNGKKGHVNEGEKEGTYRASESCIDHILRVSEGDQELSLISI